MCQCFQQTSVSWTAEWAKCLCVAKWRQDLNKSALAWNIQFWTCRKALQGIKPFWKEREGLLLLFWQLKKRGCFHWQIMFLNILTTTFVQWCKLDRNKKQISFKWQKLTNEGKKRNVNGGSICQNIQPEQISIVSGWAAHIWTVAYTDPPGRTDAIISCILD